MFICHWRACDLKLKLDRLNNQIDLRNFTQDEAMKVNEISWELDLECRPQSHYINENVNFQFQIYLYTFSGSGWITANAVPYKGGNRRTNCHGRQCNKKSLFSIP